MRANDWLGVAMSVSSQVQWILTLLIAHTRLRPIK